MKSQFQTLVFLILLIPVLAFSKGTKKKALTLTNGMYEEFFDTDSIEQIGSVLFNVNTQNIVGFTETSNETVDTSISPNIISRWLSLDPLASKYPSISPYVFVANSPIQFVDPDGKRIFIYYQVSSQDGKSTTLQKAEYKGGKLVDKKGNEIVTNDPFANNVVSTLNNIASTKNGNTVVSAIVNSKKKTEILGTNSVMNTSPDGKEMRAGALNQEGISDAQKVDMLANELFAVYQNLSGEKGNDLNKEVASFLFSNGVAQSFDPNYSNPPQGDETFNNLYSTVLNSSEFDQKQYTNLVEQFPTTPIGEKYANQTRPDGSTFHPPLKADKKDPTIKNFFPLIEKK